MTATRVTSSLIKADLNSQVGTAYTLVLGDNLKAVTMNNASANVITIPTNAAVAFITDETRIDCGMLGVGVTSLTADTGVTLNGVSAGSVTLTQYGGGALYKVGTDEWWFVTNGAAETVPAELTYTDESFDAASGGDTASYSFTSQAFGTADATRKIVVGVSGRKSGGTGTNTGLASMTIGGVSATLVVSGASVSANQIEMWIADVPTGTTGTIDITWNLAQNKCGISVYSLINSSGANGTSSSTAATLTSGQMLIAEGGCMVGMAFNAQTTATATWTELTEDHDTNDGESWQRTAAHKNYTSIALATSTVVWSSANNDGAVFATFAPA